MSLPLTCLSYNVSNMKESIVQWFKAVNSGLHPPHSAIAHLYPDFNLRCCFISPDWLRQFCEAPSTIQQNSCVCMWNRGIPAKVRIHWSGSQCRGEKVTLHKVQSDIFQLPLYPTLLYLLTVMYRLAFYGLWQTHRWHESGTGTFRG